MSSNGYRFINLSFLFYRRKRKEEEKIKDSAKNEEIGANERTITKGRNIAFKTSNHQKFCNQVGGNKEILLQADMNQEENEETNMRAVEDKEEADDV